ncbi:MAG: glycosyltransferase [Acidobacteriota bacterium]
MSTDADSRVFVVLPSKDEEPNLARLLPRIADTAEDLASLRRIEVVVVDDGSTDGSAALLDRLDRELPIDIEVVTHERNLGLGASLRDGLLAALRRADADDVVVTMDADDSHPPRLIPDLLARLDEGCDVAIASRFVPGAEIHGVPWFRRLTGRGASWLFGLLLPVAGASDYTCGYRAYRAGLLQRAFDRLGDGFIQEPGFSCMLETLSQLSALEKPQVGEAPLVLRYDRKEGPSKMRVAATIAASLRLAWRRRILREGALAEGLGPPA